MNVIAYQHRHSTRTSLFEHLAGMQASLRKAHTKRPFWRNASRCGAPLKGFGLWWLWSECVPRPQRAWCPVQWRRNIRRCHLAPVSWRGTRGFSQSRQFESATAARAAHSWRNVAHHPWSSGLHVRHHVSRSGRGTVSCVLDGVVYLTLNSCERSLLQWHVEKHLDGYKTSC